MRTYRLVTPLFRARVYANEDDVVICSVMEDVPPIPAAGPMIGWSQGKTYGALLAFCRKKWGSRVTSKVVRNG